MNYQILQTILTIVCGGGVIGLIEFFIRRRDEKNDKNDKVLNAIDELNKKVDERFNTLDKKIDSVDRKGDERNAITARREILRFRDEMLEGRGHTHDSFQQVLSDIDEYEKYCEETPSFRNNQTISTIQHIKANYEERLEKRDFL